MCNMTPDATGTRAAREPGGDAGARCRPIRRWVWALALAQALIGSVGAAAVPVSSASPGLWDEDQQLEFRVKAAFLYNFARYTTWPEQAFTDSRAPFVFAVLGKCPMADALDELLDGKTVQERPIVVRRLSEGQDPGVAHVLFLADDQARTLDTLLERLQGRPVFSVSDLPGTTGSGGVARFLLEDGKVKFEINVEVATRSGLAISSQLLKLARIVVDGEKG